MCDDAKRRATEGILSTPNKAQTPDARTPFQVCSLAVSSGSVAGVAASEAVPHAVATVGAAGMMGVVVRWRGCVPSPQLVN